MDMQKKKLYMLSSVTFLIKEQYRLCDIIKQNLNLKKPNGLEESYL